MGAFFIAGEKKVRPGVYFRYEDYGTPPTAGADDGVGAVTIRSNWGPLNEAVLLENYTEIEKKFGDGGTNGTTAAALEQFKGGVNTAYAIRIGTGGTNGSYVIKDTAETPTTVITLTLKYPGDRAFAVTIRPTADDPTVSELIFLEGTTQLESIAFSNATNSVAALMAAFAEQGSEYFVLTKTVDSTNALATVTQAAITPGTNPTVNNAAYSAALEVLEAYRWNVLSIDTEEPAVHEILKLYLNRLYEGGRFCMGVVGEPTTVAFETRLTHAAAFNDYQIVYVGHGFIDTSGKTYEGYLAAARIAGLIASTPSSESITHSSIASAVDLSEPLTNAQYIKAIQSGMLTFSLSAANVVWVEQGINTLVSPGANDDEGWKKIKRVKVRFELFQRLNDSTEPLVGKVNNDEDGRANVIQVGNNVCREMIAEKKLLAGARVELDPDNPPQGDSAWFIVFADDVDALEKLYFNFKFRFTPEE